MTPTLPDGFDPLELRRFLDTFLYREEAFLIDEILAIDPVARRIEARFDTRREMPYGRFQRPSSTHPPHVPGPEMIIITGNLGCLHAWYFHGCRWDDGWVGFGNRIHRADFVSLADIGPPLDLRSLETRARVGPRRIVIRYQFSFRQGDRDVYYGDQSAMFLKDAASITLRSSAMS